MFDWFMTVPGILVLCGIVLLIIAVVLFMLGNKSEKKEGKVTPSVDTNTSNDVIANNEVITNNEVNTVEPAPVEAVNTENATGVIDFTPDTNINNEENLDLSINKESQDLDLSMNNETPDLDLSLNTESPDLDLSIGNEVVEEAKTSVEEAPMVSIGGPDLLSNPIPEPINTNDSLVTEPEIKVVEPEQPTDIPTISMPEIIAAPEVVEEVKPIEPEINIEAPVMDAPVIPEPVVETPVVEPVVETPAVEPAPVEAAPVDETPLDLGFSAPLEQQVIEPTPAVIDLQPAQVQVDEIKVENN